MALRWSHAVLYVRDLDNMLDYYTGVLGFEVTDRGPLGPGGPDIVFMSQVEDDHHQIAFLPLRKDEAPSNSVNHFAFRVDSLMDVRAVAERIRDDGRSGNLRPLTHGNTWSIYFSDPEGNGIEVFCNTPWHVRQPQGESWDMTLSDEKLLEATRQQFEGKEGFMPAAEFERIMTERFRRQ